MRKEKIFMLLRTKYPNLQLSLLNNEDLEVFASVVKWVIDDAGEENGIIILTDILQDLDSDTMQMWLAYIKDGLKNNIPRDVIPEAIGFIQLHKQEYNKEMRNKN